MKISFALAVLLGCIFVGTALADVFFNDKFQSGISNWVVSKSKDNYGEWKHTAGDWYGSEGDKGLQASQDARHYAISAKFDKLLESNKGKDLVLQFTAKFQQGIDCGGAYIKLLPKDTDQTKFNGDSQYAIMFGPDVCGSTKRIHLIFNYRGQNLLWKKQPPCETDKLTHIYTAIIHPDNTYEVLIDNVKKESGNLADDWDFLPAKTIADPSAKKPADWVDEKEIVDPEDKKPEDWDNEPKFINDPEAKKPEDWDDEEDGQWEAPKIANPKHKGEWKAKTIPNPEYKGEWKAPEIANPDYFEDAEIYKQENLNLVGIEIWTVKAGTVFDNILVTDDVSVAKAEAENILESNKKEKEMFDKIEEEKKAKEEAERKKIEEEAKRKQEEEEAKKRAEEAAKETSVEQDEAVKEAQEAAEKLKETTTEAKDEL